MTDEKGIAEADEATYALEIEQEADTDEIMREAVEAVEAQRQAPSEDDEEGALDDSEIDTLRFELQQAEDRAVRALADYENFRRRVQREREDTLRYAGETAVSEFLPVVDNLARALEAEGSFDDFKQGVEMIHRQMKDVLTRLDVVQVPAVGERFDPSVHEAVSKEERADVDHPTVLEEYQVGFRLHDRLLRPAMVRVAIPLDDGSDESDSDAPADEQS